MPVVLSVGSRRADRGWLDRVRLGVVDYDRTLFLAGYDLI